MRMKRGGNLGNRRNLNEMRLVAEDGRLVRGTAMDLRSTRDLMHIVSSCSLCSLAPWDGAELCCS